MTTQGGEIMKYDILPEFRILGSLQVPLVKPFLKIANACMPYIQHGKKMYPGKLKRKQVQFSTFKSDLISPAAGEVDSAILYCHGGAFVIKAAAYHKELVQEYSLLTNSAVLMPDYSMAYDHPFPQPVEEILSAYRYILKKYPDKKIVVAGDSAGASLAASVVMLAHEKGMRIPDGLMLVYPVLDSRMCTESMKNYYNTPVWNNRLNKKMWSFYLQNGNIRPDLTSPITADSLAYFPKTYIEVTQYDCLHDEGKEFAERLKDEGIEAEINETEHTMHGYDGAMNSDYVKEQVKKRIAFLNSI